MGVTGRARVCLKVAVFAAFAALLFPPLAVAQKPPAKSNKRKTVSATPTPGKQAAAPASKTRGEIKEEQTREGDKPRLREKYFYEQREYPLGFIPYGIRLQAIERREEMRRQERARRLALGFDPLSIPANPTTWTPIGPRPVNTPATFSPFVGLPVNSGRIAAIAVDPRDANVVYLGGAQGGVWKTTDGGANWNALTDNEVTLAIGSIALDPSNPDIVYVGTGEQTFSGSSYYGAGVLKSTNGGTSWTQLGQASFVGPFSSGFSPGGGARIGSIAVHPQNGQIILAGVLILASFDTGTSSGIYRSTDGGTTWTNVRPGAAGTEVFFDPNDATGNTAYAALGSPAGDAENGIYKSTNGGATWAPANGTGANVITSGTAAGRIEMAVGPPTVAGGPGVLYAGVTDPVFGDDALGVFKSTDGGANWTRLNNAPNYCGSQCVYDNVIRVHPTNPNVVFAGGAAGALSTIDVLWRTLDGGATWQEVHNSANGQRLHVDLHALAFSNPAVGPLRLYAGNDGGVWSTTDITAAPGSINWTNLNGTLSLSQYYPGISISSATLDLGYGGTQDNGTHRFSGNLAWDMVTGGDGGWTAMDPNVPSTVYTTCQFICIFKSTSDGVFGSFVTGPQVESGINQSDPVAFIPPILHDPTISGRLYFGTDKVYQTMNGAASWTAISPSFGGGTVRSIAVAPNNSDFVYAGTFSGMIQRTANAASGAGAVWTNLTTSDLPGRVATSVGVHPTDPNIAYATFSGFSRPPGGDPALFPDTKGHVFKLTIVMPAGTPMWQDISIAPYSVTPLPNTPANDILVDPDVPSTLYVATDVGVFVSSDDGINWTTLMSGLPSVAVTSLELHRPTRTLRAGTHGRGMWDLQLANFNPAYVLSSMSPTNSPVGAPAFTLTVNGNGFTALSVVNWNASALVTTFVSANQLTAQVTAAQVSAGGSFPVTVFDPGQPAPGLTNPLVFTVSNPLPVLDSISPTSAAPGGPAFTLTANGSNFVTSSVVRWNGSDRTTAFVSSAQLTATITAADIASPGVNIVEVFTPSGGGTSQPLGFGVGTPPVNDDFANAITISPIPFADTRNNAAATNEPGEPMAPCTSGFGFPGNAHSIWYKITPAANMTDVVVDASASQFFAIVSVWTGASVSTLTNVACDFFQLRVNLTAGTTYYFMVAGLDSLEGGQTDFRFSIIPPPPNDNFANAIVIGSSPFTDTQNNSSATNEAGDPSTPCTTINGSPGNFNSIWYRITPTTNLSGVNLDTIGSVFDTVLSVWTGAGLGSLTSFACNDDIGGGNLNSRLTLNLTAGTTYHIMVGGFSPFDFGTVILNLTAPATFTLAANPATVTVVRGQSGTSTVTATPSGGPFNGAITFACTGLPAQSSCSFNPTSVTPGANPASTQVTISTTAPAMIYTPPMVWPAPPVYLLLFALAALLFFLMGWMRRNARTWRYACYLAAIVILAGLAVACGGGSSGGGGGSNQGTPRGTFTVTVRGTSGATSAQTTITLTVN